MEEFDVIVERVMSPAAARVYREPDFRHPRGRMYGLRLSRVVDVHGNFTTVRRGDRLLARVETQPEVITLARVVARVGQPAEMEHA